MQSRAITGLATVYADHLFVIFPYLHERRKGRLHRVSWQEQQHLSPLYIFTLSDHRSATNRTSNSTSSSDLTISTWRYVRDARPNACLHQLLMHGGAKTENHELHASLN